MSRSSVDLSKFSQAIKQLSSLSGNDLSAVLKAETSKILETAVRYTPKADREKLKQQVEADTRHQFERGKSDAGHLHTNKKDGKVWFSPGNDGKKWFLINDWKVSDSVYRAFLQVQTGFIDDYRRTLKRRLKEALARRGLTAKTWLQIAAAIGAPEPKVPGFISKAQIPDAIGSGQVFTGPKSVVIEGGNDSGVLLRTRTGQGIINRAIRSRAKFMETAIRKGALNTLETRTKSFPHLFK
jgi:hypothetical protein